MPVDVGHDGIHHDHFAEAFLRTVRGGEFQHVIDAEWLVEETVGGNEASIFRGEDGAFACELAMELHQRIGNVVGFRCL